MASCNAVLKSESKSELRQVSNSAQAQHFSSLELLLDSYMPEMALSSKLSPRPSLTSLFCLKIGRKGDYSPLCVPAVISGNFQ